MIIERFPGVQDLSTEEKWMLIDEIQEALLAAAERKSLDQAISANLDEQLAHYEAHPETAKPWAEVLARLRNKQ